MSIRSDAYQLCKTIWDSPSREGIKDIILDLNTASEVDGKITGRAGFGYMARQLRAQILGYLIIDRDKAKLEQDIPPLRVTDTLREDERRILEGAHCQLTVLNKECIATLIDQLPQCSPAIDPYSKFQYEISEDVTDMDLLTPENIKVMADSFATHPGFSIALECPEKIDEELSSDQLARYVHMLEEYIINAGPFNTPSNLSRIANTSGKYSKERLIIRYVSALICIRASLAILDELVYQAILTNKLPVLNQDNIIRVGSFITHISGTGISLLCQLDEEVGEMGVFESYLVLLKDSSIDYISDLCRIDAERVAVNKQFGNTKDFDLRDIDENLNPFNLLLKNI